MSRNKPKGFTLLEIMIVVAIIGILVSLGIYKTVGHLETAREMRVQSDLQTIKTQLTLYESRNGFYPTTDQGVKALVTEPTTEPILGRTSTSIAARELVILTSMMFFRLGRTVRLILLTTFGRSSSSCALQKIIALFLADRFLEAFEHQHHVFPDFAFFRRRLIAQKIRGMISDHQRRFVE